MKHLIFILLLSLSFGGFSQDSSLVLRFDEYMEIVRTQHPLSFQAQLQEEKGSAKLLKARGGFDPKVDGSISQKYFDDKQYYSYIHGGLKVPTFQIYVRVIDYKYQTMNALQNKRSGYKRMSRIKTSKIHRNHQK